MGECEQDDKQTHVEEDINIIFEATTFSPRLMYNNQFLKKEIWRRGVLQYHILSLETYIIHLLKIKTLIFSLSHKHCIFKTESYRADRK